MTKKRFITLVAVILLISTVGAMVPLHEAKAAGIPGGVVPTGVAGAGVTVCTALIYGGVISGGSSTVLGVGCYIGALALGGIASLAGSYFEKTAWIAVIATAFRTFGTASLDFITGFIETAIRGSAYLPFPEQIYSVWKFVRDFVNMFFILILIIMAFGTIFDIDHYKFKDLFVSFLIAAVLVNFSFAIGKYIINISNDLSIIFLQPIVKSTSDGTLGITAMLHRGFGIKFLGNPDSSVWRTVFFFTPGNAMANLVDALWIFSFLIFAAFTTLVSSLMILARAPVLWVLLILSPVAWFGMVLPFSKKNLWNRWWEYFLSWAFYLPVYFLVFMMLNVMLNVLGSTVGGTILGEGSIVYFILTSIFLIGGIWLSFQVGKQFKGGVGVVAGWAQNVVKSLPIPYSKQITGKQRSISNIEGGAKAFWTDFKKTGGPEEGKFSWLRRVWGGTQREAQSAQEVSGGFKRALGYGAGDLLRGHKAEMESITHEITNEEAKIAQGTKIEDILEEIKELEKAGTGLIDRIGNVNASVAAKYMVVASKGALDNEHMRKFVSEVSERNPVAAQELMKRSAAANFTGDYAPISRLVAPADDEERAQASVFRTTAALGARKELYQWAITEEGKKMLKGVKTDPEVGNAFMQDVQDSFGGRNTGEFKRFLKETAKVRPDLVVNFLSRPRTADGVGPPAPGTSRKELYRDYFPSAPKDISEAPLEVWNDGEFLEEFAERMSRLTEGPLKKYEETLSQLIQESGKDIDGKSDAFVRALKLAGDKRLGRIVAGGGGPAPTAPAPTTPSSGGGRAGPENYN